MTSHDNIFEEKICKRLDHCVSDVVIKGCEYEHLRNNLFKPWYLHIDICTYQFVKARSNGISNGI